MRKGIFASATSLAALMAATGAAAQNAADCQRLWQVSAELCGR